MNNTQLELIENFTAVLDDLDRVLKQVPEEGIDWAEKEGEWTIRQVLHHLAEDCNVYAFIIERALATPGGKVFFGEFIGNQAWGERLAWHERSVDIALEMIHVHRKFLAELVGHFPERWDNTINFYNESAEKVAEQSVRQMMIMLTEHMQEHVAMIEQILSVQT